MLRLYDLLGGAWLSGVLGAGGAVALDQEPPNPERRGGRTLFAQFFEDHDTPTNRSAGTVDLARYLLREKGLAGSGLAERLPRVDSNSCAPTLLIANPACSFATSRMRINRLGRRELNLRRRARTVCARPSSRSPGERGAAGVEFHALLHRRSKAGRGIYRKPSSGRLAGRRSHRCHP